MLNTFLNLISNPAFLDFLSTFGLAVAIVVYFIFFRDPKYYDKLMDNYEDLRESYRRIDDSLQPEKREMSQLQTTMICQIALDRDLYKLHYLLSKKINNDETTSVRHIIRDTIFNTTSTWSKFKSPFLKVPCISDLYGVYSNNGEKLEKELESIINAEGPSKQDKKDIIWNKLLEIIHDMKNEMELNLKNLEQGETVKPFQEP